ncbi:hypothetical protein [Azonexus sp. IMCC34839]|uniref:hypothetical protein n=1 Tax=Azonexus sp. IMCC34839 TaxID=3133695 RepID=UPI003999AA22
MKKRPTPENRAERLGSGTDFSGTTNPRHLRVIHLALRRPLRREHIDDVAGASNGPDLVAELRRRGLEFPCDRVPAFDRDGKPCRPGVYHLTNADRIKIMRWLKTRELGAV